MLNFTLQVVMGIIYGFVTFILEDPNFYNLSKTEAAESMGFIGMLSEVANIIAELMMGLIINIFGRKKPLILVLVTAGFSTAAIPLFTELYPWFCIFRILINLGAAISGNIPLLPDYVQKESLGKANAYALVLQTLGAIFS